MCMCGNNSGCGFGGFDSWWIIILAIIIICCCCGNGFFGGNSCESECNCGGCGGCGGGCPTPYCR